MQGEGITHLYVSNPKSITKVFKSTLSITLNVNWFSQGEIEPLQCRKQDTINKKN